MPSVPSFAKTSLSLVAMLACAAATPAPSATVTANGHVVALFGNTAEPHAAQVDGKPFALPQDAHTADILQFKGTLAGGGKTYVVLTVASPGNACPELYMAIDVTEPLIRSSPVFGNCTLGRFAVDGGILKASFPSGGAPSEVDRFMNGNLTEAAR